MSKHPSVTSKLGLIKEVRFFNAEHFGLCGSDDGSKTRVLD
jgi:hypothetical protein